MWIASCFQFCFLCRWSLFTTHAKGSTSFLFSVEDRQQLGPWAQLSKTITLSQVFDKRMTEQEERLVVILSNREGRILIRIFVSKIVAAISDPSSFVVLQVAMWPKNSINSQEIILLQVRRKTFVEMQSQKVVYLSKSSEENIWYMVLN